MTYFHLLIQIQDWMTLHLKILQKTVIFGILELKQSMRVVVVELQLLDKEAGVQQ
jgi:hypothetical protein